MVPNPAKGTLLVIQMMEKIAVNRSDIPLRHAPIMETQTKGADVYPNMEFTAWNKTLPKFMLRNTELPENLDFLSTSNIVKENPTQLVNPRKKRFCSLSNRRDK